MNRIAIFSIAAFLLLLIQPATADCKYFKNKDGFPLGIIPSPGNLTATFKTPTPQNLTFKLYIEAEFGTTTSIECRVRLTNENKSIALNVELSNYTLETGAALIERPFVVYLTPTNTVNFPELIETTIKITDVDNPNNFAILPIRAKFEFPRSKPSPSPTATPSVAPADNGSIFYPIQTVKPTTATNSSINTIVKLVEDNTSKYMIAIVAFLFLAALLWMGFNSLQRD